MLPSWFYDLPDQVKQQVKAHASVLADMYDCDEYDAMQIVKWRILKRDIQLQPTTVYQREDGTWPSVFWAGRVEWVPR